MSEFIIHNVLFDVANRMCDFNGDEEQEKPVYEYPNHYLGKIIGKRGQKERPIFHEDYTGSHISSGACYCVAYRYRAWH